MALLVVAITAVTACSSGTDNDGIASGPADTLNVITTIYPVTYFAERVGGESATVRSLAKPGVEAHDFEPSPRDIIDLRNADVFIYTSPAFEVWVEDALDTVGGDNLRVVATADLSGLEIQGDHGHEDEENHGDGIDPHVWLNPLEAIGQVRTIQAAFSEVDAAGTELYAANADALVAELQALDTDIAAALNSCALDHMVVSHEAYGHLAERYNIEQIGLADLSAEFETTPRRIADIIEQIQELGISYILQEPILSDDLAQTVSDETGAEILPMHPIESLTPAELDAGDTYFTVMRRNLESLKTALECS